MARRRSRFACTACEYETTKWFGRCPSCGEWNTLQEAAVASVPRQRGVPVLPARPLTALDDDPESRLPTGLQELDRVLGGGLVAGALMLLGGEPGVGKSTLLLQAAGAVAATTGSALYVSGEESASQLALRARRVGIRTENLYVVAQQDVGGLLAQVEQVNPRLLVIDSIHTMTCPGIDGEAGGLRQLRAAATFVHRLAKERQLPAFLVGHETKRAGVLAGPQTLFHLVDAVLYFENEPHEQYRILRARKNRFGATNEVGIFRMTGQGMEDVVNASEHLLAERVRDVPGTAVAAAVEGNRPLLAEVQALAVPSGGGGARRMATGIDRNRLSLLAAVLERRAGLALADADIYVKVVGGVSFREPAADLAVAAAVASARRGVPVHPDAVSIGEIGLTGELRGVPRLDERLREAARLGFRRAVLPQAGEAGASRAAASLELIRVARLDQALAALLHGLAE